MASSAPPSAPAPVTKVIEHGEEIVWWDQPSIFIKLPEIVGGVVLGGAALVGGVYLWLVVGMVQPALVAAGGGLLGFLAAGYNKLEHSRTFYVVTDKRVIHSVDLFGRSTQSRPLDEILEVDTSIPAALWILKKLRVLNLGNIIIRTADDRAEIFQFRMVSDVTSVESTVRAYSVESSPERDDPARSQHTPTREATGIGTESGSVESSNTTAGVNRQAPENPSPAAEEPPTQDGTSQDTPSETGYSSAPGQSSAGSEDGREESQFEPSDKA